MQTDEEYARKLQQEFDKNYNKAIRDENRDRKLAQQLQKIEASSTNMHQTTTLTVPSQPTTFISSQNTASIFMNPISSTLTHPVMLLPYQTHNVFSNSIQISNTSTISSNTYGTIPGSFQANVQQQQHFKKPSQSKRKNKQSNNQVMLRVSSDNGVRSSSDSMQTITNNLNNTHTHNLATTTDAPIINGLHVRDKFSLLSTHEYKLISNNKIEDNECTICLEEFKYKCYVTYLACMHKFHTDCIRMWLEVS